jgi:hypothetical protein
LEAVRKLGLSRVIDLSAAPFFLSGSGRTARAGTTHGVRAFAHPTRLHAGYLVADGHQRIIVSAVSLTDPPQRPNCRWFCLLLQD